MGALFPLGRLVATPAALTALAAAGENPVGLLVRHQRGDWGDVGPEDRRANDRDLRQGGRLLNAYGVGDSRLWVITEADRSVTTMLLPEEY
jgi:hypothetical protein